AATSAPAGTSQRNQNGRTGVGFTRSMRCWIRLTSMSTSTDARNAACSVRSSSRRALSSAVASAASATARAGDRSPTSERSSARSVNRLSIAHDLHVGEPGARGALFQVLLELLQHLADRSTRQVERLGDVILRVPVEVMEHGHGHFLLGEAAGEK